MKRLFPKTYRFLSKMLPSSLRKWLKSRNSVEYPIIKNPEKKYVSIFHIKDDTWESAEMIEVFNLLKPWTITQYHAHQDILQINDCIIRPDSDIIVTNDGCVWDKVYLDVFSKVVPLDNGLIDYSYDNITIRKSCEQIQIAGNCISLLGVHASIWAHFLVQFLPKLYYAEEAGLLNKDISVIMPEYKDKQVKELVTHVLDKYPNIRRYEIKQHAPFTIHCDTLFYIPSAATLSNHASWLAPFDIVIPKRVIDVLNNNVVKPRINSIIVQKVSPHDKLYLVRRDSPKAIGKSMKNIGAIEQFFKDKGFYFVEPHLLSFEEKVNLFYHAKEIVGPFSSAWTNVVFCKKAKGLMFSPLCRTMDAYYGYISSLGMEKWLMVTGDDSNQTIHSDYCISLEKIDTAYQYLTKKY